MLGLCSPQVHGPLTAHHTWKDSLKSNMVGTRYLRVQPRDTGGVSPQAQSSWRWIMTNVTNVGGGGGSTLFSLSLPDS